jgi:transcriptional regulator with XRE-family HTH domain
MARTYRQATKALGARIRGIREAKGMSRGELSREAGIHIERLGELERGHKRASTNNDVNPRLDTLYRIATALSTDIGDLLLTTQQDSPQAELQQEVVDLLKGQRLPELRKARQILAAYLIESEE